mmetsp:Transcript_79153/g.224050  ORF Transcript_79153/g.224050 Transcript_79153/m.224050 type:complete len:621 (+) Transcript_79153:119-1981(+)
MPEQVPGRRVFWPLARDAPPAGPPVLWEPREEFRLLGGSEDRPVTSGELARCWHHMAATDRRRQGCTPLGPQDRQVVALAAAQMVRDVGFRSAGCIHMDEWVHHRLSARSQFSTPAAPAQINAALREALQTSPGLLGELQWLFEVADRSHVGSLSFRDVAEVCRCSFWRFQSYGQVPTGDPERVACDLFEAMDLDSARERVAYPEFVAYCLGQRKHTVTLHLYDLSDGLARALSPWLLGQQVEGLWHTGVVVHGREYYFGGDIYQDKPGETRFGLPTKRISFGFTLRSNAELATFLICRLRPQFTRDVYDVLHHNCNHFADAVSMHLVGRHVPDEVLRLGECAVGAPAILRPLLNRWLDSVEARARGGGAKGGKQAPHPARGTKPLERQPHSSVVAPILWKGQVVSIFQVGTAEGTSMLGQVVGAAGEGDSLQQQALNLPSRVWVRYYEPPGQGRRGSVRTELVERTRISAAPVCSTGVAAYHDALDALEATRAAECKDGVSRADWRWSQHQSCGGGGAPQPQPQHAPPQFGAWEEANARLAAAEQAWRPRRPRRSMPAERPPVFQSMGAVPYMPHAATSRPESADLSESGGVAVDLGCSIADRVPRLLSASRQRHLGGA